MDYAVLNECRQNRPLKEIEDGKIRVTKGHICALKKRFVFFLTLSHVIFHASNL